MSRQTGILAMALALLCGACMEFQPIRHEDLGGRGHLRALFAMNEGNYMNETASLSVYYPDERVVENEAFFRANGKRLGDVAQSMAVHDGRGFIVVNNSGAVYVIDLETLEVTGGMTELGSPRYIHILSGTKAYLTDLYASRITIFDPSTLRITGHIPTPGHRSTEQMVRYGKYVFTNCWSYDNKILVIDTERDAVVDSIEVGKQPTSLAIDRHGQIWTVTDGGYEGSPYGQEIPVLCCIDAATRRITKRIPFALEDSPSEVSLNASRDTLYFINRDIWRLPVTADKLPEEPFLKYRETIYYGLTVDPETSEVYVADAIDYSQPGVIYRYTPSGEEVDRFTAGIIPGAFCFKPSGPHPAAP